MNTNVYFNLVARAKKILLHESDRKLAAQRFVSAVLCEYVSKDLETRVRPLQHPLAAEMGFFTRTQSPAVAAYLIGSTYSMLLPDEYRQRNGVFYTPPALANRLLDQVEACGIDWSQARVLDPACGCGVFLLLAADRMMKACSDLTPEQRLARIGRNLKGIELDEFSGWMSEVFLRKALQHDFEASGLTHSAFVEIRDSLTVDPKDLEAYDLVVGNPPYGKIKLDPETRQIWTRGLYGHANLYGLFTDLAVRLTAPGGIIAYVTPASFLGGQYFRALRELLMNEAPPTTFDFVTQREGVFAGVLQETVLSVFKKDLNPKTVSVSYLKVSGLEKLSVTSNGSYPLLKGGVPWVLPRNKEQSDMMKHYARMTFRLSDYGYKVSTGPLVWNRNKARLSKVKIQGTVPVIWAESIPPGEKGLFSYKVSGRNHVPWYSPSSKMDPNLIRESCVLLQRTTSLEQERRLIAAVLPESFLKYHGGLVTVENHVNMIRPLPGRHPLVGPEVIATLLNSRVLDGIFRCINGSTAVSAYELESLPLPDPESLKKLKKAIENKRFEDIENLVKDLYTNERSKAAA